MAFDSPQCHVIDHTTTQESPQEQRNQFKESQRLVRGKLHELSAISPKLLDILVIPGGQGPIKNWIHSDSLEDGRRLLPELDSFLRAMRDAGGVLGFLSLSEFIATAFDGDWPQGKGCLDLGPEEVLVDVEKGRVLCPGNLSAENLSQLKRAMAAFLEALLALAMERKQRQRT